MTYSLGMSEMGGDPLIIDDSNFERFAGEITPVGQPGYTGGFEASQVVESFGNAPTRSLIPRDQWDDLIREQEKNESSPDHWRLAGNVPITDQNGYGYCWMYGTVGAIMTAYAQQGMEVPKLNPFGPAYQGKRGRNVGGWAGEALEYIEKYGIPEQQVWSMHDTRVNPRDESVVRSSSMHGVVAHETLPRNSFDWLASYLLDPERSTPVTQGYSWMGHLMYTTKIVKTPDGRYGAKLINSWKESWGQKGTAIFVESKAKAFEQIAIVSVKPRVAV